MTPREADFSLTSSVSTARRNIKRNIDDFEADGLGLGMELHSSKRTALAFRTLPKQGRLPNGGVRTTSFTSQTQVPTPIESSEDEMCDIDEQLDSTTDHTQNSAYLDTDSGTSLVSANVAEALLQPRNISPVSYKSAMPPFKTSTPRDNLTSRNHQGLSLSPHCFHDARPQHQLPTDRIPTPISSSFRPTSNLRPPLIRTALTPPMGGYTPDTANCPQLPSPSSQDYDMDTGMSSPSAPIDQMMSDLSTRNLNCDPTSLLGVPVSPSDDDGSMWQRRAARGNEGLQQIAHRMTSPRLHMGYRVDCEKCRLRVPGHYNHVIWSS